MAPPRDLRLGSFSDTPPWLVEADGQPWRAHLDLIREAADREVPDLVRPHRVPPVARMLRVVAPLGWALAGWALRDRGRLNSRAGLSLRLRLAFERIGPTFIKLGQILASGTGVFPDELVAEFTRCRDEVAPERFSDVRLVVEADLGRPLEAVFDSFDPTPLAAASIAQVHRARLRTGEEVVVKVQRPRVDALVRADLEVMAWLAPALVGRIPVTALANPPAVVELFAETILAELDFRLEAENMLDVAASLTQLGQRGYVVPRPHPELVTRRVLVMERLEGFRFDDVASMTDAGVDLHAIVRTAMVGFMEGAMIHGVFHGDLHPGNLLVMADGRTALMDFGITGRLDEGERLAFLRLVVAGTMNDLPGQLSALSDLGAFPPDLDQDAIISELGLDRPTVDPTTLDTDELVTELQRVITALLGRGARIPKELMLFVKNLLFVDNAIATLAPDLDLFAELTAISAHFARAHGDQIAVDVGVDPRTYELDLGGVRTSFGVDDSTDSLTHRELQARRELLRRRLGERGRRAEP